MEPLTHILTGVVEAAKKAKRRTKPAVVVKVSPDEDSEEQISGICDAVWESGVDGVIVGNSTTLRPDPLPTGYILPSKEAAAMLEQGGYSGPQLFDKTLALVRRYRRKLDEGSESKPRPPLDGRAVSESQSPSKLRPTSGESSKSQPLSKPSTDAPTPQNPDTDTSTRIDATVVRDIANLKPDTPEAMSASKSQPIVRIPVRNNPSTCETADSDASPALSSSTHTAQLPLSPIRTTESASSSPAQPPTPPKPDKLAVPFVPPKRKIIFATGGITNGKQALEVLDAGASVAMIYTAVSVPKPIFEASADTYANHGGRCLQLVYSGVGTCTRIKGEMREEIARRKG